MRPIASIFLTSASLLIAAPALATSLGSASVDYSLSLSNPEGVLVSVYEDLATTDSDFGESGRAPVSAEAADLTASISGTSDVHGPGFASTTADASSFFIVENEGEESATYLFDLMYTISAEATSLSPSDSVFAFADLSVIDDFGDTLFETELSFDSLNLGQNTLSGTEQISLSLGGYDFNSAEVFAEISTSAVSSVAPIPLPAAGWLLVAGLGGLAALRRRGA